MDKVVQKLTITNANLTLENAKLSALVEQQQEEIENLKVENEEGNQHEN